MHMMPISPENEEFLNDAVANGQYPSQEAALADALRLLRDNKNGDDATGLPPDQWNIVFKEFLASLPRTEATFVDVSRESIYEGRG